MNQLLGNRIALSLVAVVGLAYAWEFHVKPAGGPLYTAAVGEYKKQHWEESLKLLKKAYRLDPNDAAILTLLGWNYLKSGNARAAEPYFRRAHRLDPRGRDTLLGLADTEIALKKYEEAASLIEILSGPGDMTVDVHAARAAFDRALGRNRDAAREFRAVLALDPKNTLALKNLREIYNAADVPGEISLEFAPLVRPKELAYTARVQDERFAWRAGDTWNSAYLTGVNLTPVLPGHLPIDAPPDTALYLDWFQRMSELGANAVRASTLLSPAFYRALAQFNGSDRASPHTRLRLLQGIFLSEPPRDDFFNPDYVRQCQKEIAGTIDAIHGQGDIAETDAHAGGIFATDVASWVAGIVAGQDWPPHAIVENDRRHSGVMHFQGTFIEVSGSATEVFLAQMLDYAAEYEESKYNWLHPLAFLSWPALDPIRHPTESTLLEEAVLRQARGESVATPAWAYDDDDDASLDPLHLRARPRLVPGYFAAYNVFPFYPDFIGRDPSYRQVQDAEGPNSFFGYLKDLKAHHGGIPLLITEYGVPTSLGIGHFSPAGFNQGGLNAEQQDRLLARFTRNIFDAGAAGGLVFEWLDEWFRRSWLFRTFETPEGRGPLWRNMMDPAQHYGLLGAEPHHARTHRFSGGPSQSAQSARWDEWAGVPPIYTKVAGTQPSPVLHSARERYDPARTLKALYADADESFLYLRLVTENLDNDRDGRPDWAQANYLIGISTAPARAGLTHLPFIVPIEFPMGMTYAIELSGPESSRIWVASSYNPFQIVLGQGSPAQTVFATKLDWKPKVSEDGSFEAEVIETNRGRFSRDGEYFPPERYDRGVLRYGSLDPKDPDYDPLAEWHASVRTGTIDLRIPWNLLNVIDPSTLKILSGIARDGTVLAEETTGFVFVAFSYRPLESLRERPVMDQHHPLADALPGMPGMPGMNAANSLFAAGLKQYRWAAWDTPEFELGPKTSYAKLRAAFAFVSQALTSPGSSATGDLTQNRRRRFGHPHPRRPGLAEIRGPS